MSSDCSPIGMENATDFILRAYQACKPYQWVREVTVNAIEAGAKNIEFGVEWQAVVKKGVYRHMICDNGEGMSPDQLKKYFTNIQASGKRINQEMDENDRVIHTNFGIGCRISLLPWNRVGVVYISYQNGIGSMIQMYYDEEDSVFALTNWHLDDEIATVVNPAEISWEEDEIDWSKVAPDWIKDHGTCIVLMGNHEKYDTFIDSEDPDNTTNIARYINTRFYDLGDVKVGVKEFNFGKSSRNEWPRSEKEFREKIKDKTNTSRGTTRVCSGATYYITKAIPNPPKCGKLLAHDTLLLENSRLSMHWFLWEGDRPQCHEYAPQTGFIAVLYKGELYNFNSQISNFRNFNIIDKEVQTRVTIIIEPQIHTQQKKWGIFPDQNRSNLLFSGNGKKGIELPMDYWGVLFVQNFPKEIESVIKEIHKKRKHDDISADSEETLKRLLEKYGDRFVNSITIIDPNKKSKDKRDPSEEDVIVNQTGPGEITDLPGKDLPRGTGGGKSDDDKDVDKDDNGNNHHQMKIPYGKSVPGTKKVLRRIVVKKAKDTGVSEPSLDIKIRREMPRIFITDKESMKNEYNICFFKENQRFDDGTIGPVICFNEESPILLDSIRYHQSHYNVLYSDSIRKDILSAYQNVAICKAAHAMKLFKVMNKDTVIKEYLSEQAMTVALMGFISEDSLIAPRLGKYGMKNKGNVPEKDFTAPPVPVA